MFYTVLKILLISLGCTAVGMKAVHSLQELRYQVPALRRQLRRGGEHFLRANILIAAAASLIDWYLPILMSLAIQKEATRKAVCGWVVLAAFALAVGLIALHNFRAPASKPFVFTRRVCRLVVVLFLLNLAGTVVLALLSLPTYLMFAATDYAVVLAAVLMRPLEERINARYFAAARKKLAAHKGLIRIGITGSFGKTETKLILRGLLSEKYKVLATPASFSTAMGISRTVNDQLTGAHEVFIAEMGAQHRGDIRELVRLVHPRYGLLTCVGAAHLDSFGSVENASQTKYELIQGLPENGAAFFGCDGSYGDRLYALCKTEKYHAGTDPETKLYMRAENIETGATGTSLELVCEDGRRVRVHTRLLGEYNMRNLALAAAVARRLGLEMDEIARGAEKLLPLRHHLQLIAGERNLIDDSANTLPDAGNEALKVLSALPGRRIVITTGFTELDANADERNFAFGTQMRDCADYVILIGPKLTRPIVRGLMSVKFPRSSVRVVEDLEGAESLMTEISEAGDSVLYECVAPNLTEAEEEDA